MKFSFTRICQAGALCVGLGLSTGCYHVTYASGAARSDVVKSGSGAFFLWGLVGKQNINLEAACPQGVAKVTVYQSFLDGFLGAITLGIYTPRTWEAACKPGVETVGAHS